MTSVNNIPATKVASGFARRALCAANGLPATCACWFTWSKGWYPSCSAMVCATVPLPSTSLGFTDEISGNVGLNMGAHIFGPGPAKTAHARSSESRRYTRCCRVAASPGSTFRSVKGSNSSGLVSFSGCVAPPGVAVPRYRTISKSNSVGSTSPAMFTSSGPALSWCVTASFTPSMVKALSSDRFGSIRRRSPNTAWFTASCVSNSRFLCVFSSNMR
mmetsp:Transcript_38/g.122  ORF Transcript_38/g.122 Transcript_38/m.122 type:complete len:217 (+) Transcript_38:711-1361(+)